MINRLTIDQLRDGDVISMPLSGGGFGVRTVKGVHEGCIVSFHGGYVNEMLHKNETVSLLERKANDTRD
jgi:hypothetical protein